MLEFSINLSHATISTISLKYEDPRNPLRTHCKARQLGVLSFWQVRSHWAGGWSLITEQRLHGVCSSSTGKKQCASVSSQDLIVFPPLPEPLEAKENAMRWSTGNHSGSVTFICKPNRDKRQVLDLRLPWERNGWISGCISSNSQNSDKL